MISNEKEKNAYCFDWSYLPEDRPLEEAKVQEPRPIQDITSMLHEAAEESAALPENVPDLPVSGNQDVLILFGGMDLLGNIFNDIYAIKL